MATMTLSISLPTPRTKDLIPPKLEANPVITMEGDEKYDRVKWAYYQSHYEKELTKILKGQIKHMVTPLTSMQKDIDALRSAYEKATSSKDYRELQQQMESAKGKHEDLKKAIKDYQDYLDGMVKNIEKQQTLIWHNRFEKDAEAAAQKGVENDIFWKKVRHTAGIALGGVLVLAAGAAAIIASVATFGALPAVIGGIGIAVAGMGALKKVYGVGKKIYDTVKMEEASIENMRKDLAEISAHLGKSGGKAKGLEKHLNNASRFHSQRQKFITEADKEVTELDKQIKEHKSLVAKLGKLDKTPDLIKKNEKKITELTKTKEDTVKAIQASMKLDQEMGKVFKQAEDLIGDLKKIDANRPTTVADSLKGFTTMEGARNLVDNLKDIAKGAGSLVGV
jgi:septal ring factor EnvC (AmiA/AmiB activator)